MARPSALSSSHSLSNPLCSSGLVLWTAGPRNYSSVTYPVLRHHKPSSHHPAFSQFSKVGISEKFLSTLVHQHNSDFSLKRVYYKYSYKIVLNFNRKLRKPFSELADRMDAMSLNESRSTKHKTTEQKLSQLDNIFSFYTANPSSFPQSHCQEFIQQLQHLTPGKIKIQFPAVGRLKYVRFYYLFNNYIYNDVFQLFYILCISFASGADLVSEHFVPSLSLLL